MATVHIQVKRVKKSLHSDSREEEGMMFYMYRDEDQNWRWRLETVSGQVLAECPVSYTRKEDCRAVIQYVMNCRIARVHEILTSTATAFAGANTLRPGP